MSLILKSPDLAVFGGRVLSGIASLSSAFDLTAAGKIRFDVDAIDFNGSTSYVEYPNNLFGGWGWSTSGMTSGQTKGITVSFWIKPASGITNDTKEVVNHFKTSTSYGRENNFIRINYNASGQARINFSQNQDSGGNVVAVASVYGGLTLDSWNHVLIAIQMNHLASFTTRLYINDSSASIVGSQGELVTNSPDNDGTTYLGQFDEGGGAQGFYDGCLSELWIDDTYYDLDTESNRRKFIGSDGKPVELPTSPLIYLNGSSSTWTNSGTYSLGTQTLNNINDCADSPSD